MNKDELYNLLNSWENLNIIISTILSHPGYLPILTDIAISDTEPKSWRAAWVADKIHDKHPGLIAPYLNQITDQLKREKNNSKKRHFLKLISINDIPSRYKSFLINYCLNCFSSATEPVAVRVYALQILFNISEKEPDFKPELLSIITYETELQTSPGVKAKGKNLLKILKKQIQESVSGIIR
jgi:hypothetical protein